MSMPADIDLIRGFNRFYTRQLGLLDRGLLGSDFTLTEARVLYELAHHGGRTASHIADALNMDLGYLSRVIAKFERRHYLKRTRSGPDAPQSLINLTQAGRAVFAPLNTAAREQISRMLRPLTPEQRDELLLAMRSVQRLLDDEPSRAATRTHTTAPAYTIRSLRVGDIGWITRRQGQLYAEEYGWDGTYEALVAEILSGFVKNFDARWEEAWIAERDHAIVGCVFLVRASDGVAKLRLLYVEPAARGLGLGKELVGRCIDGARARGYRRLTLWTNDVLSGARRIYEAAGFQLTREEPHHSFGKDLVGQTWDLDL